MKIESWQKNVGALWLMGTIRNTGFNFFLPFFPLYLQTLGITTIADSVRWAGVVTSAAAISMVVADPLVGNLADRWGRRRVLILFGLGTSCAITAMGFVTSPEQLVGIRLFQGLTLASMGASSAIVAGTTPKHRLGFALGLMMTTQLVGQSLGPMMGGIIAGSLGFRFAFILAGILSFLSVAIAIFWVRDDFVPSSVPETKKESLLRQNLVVLSIVLVPTLLLLSFLIQFSHIIVQPMLAVFVGELSGGENPAAAAGLIVGVFGFAVGLSAVAFGRLSDRIGPRPIILVGLAMAAMLAVPQAFVTDVWQLMVLRLMLGVCLGAMKPSVSSIVAQLVPAARHGTAFGLTSAGFACANVIGPLAGGWVAGGTGSRSVFLLTAVVLGLGWTVVALQLSRHRGRLRSGSVAATQATS